MKPQASQPEALGHAVLGVPTQRDVENAAALSGMKTPLRSINKLSVRYRAVGARVASELGHVLLSKPDRVRQCLGDLGSSDASGPPQELIDLARNLLIKLFSSAELRPATPGDSNRRLVAMEAGDLPTIPVCARNDPVEDVSPAVPTSAVDSRLLRAWATAAGDPDVEAID
eukprot:5697995-Amphidinium_carterae.1